MDKALKDKTVRYVMEKVRASFGDETAKEISDASAVHLKALREQYPDIPKAMAPHADKALGLISVYRALKNCMPEEAYMLVLNGNKKTAEDSARIAKAITTLPKGDSLFLLMAKKSFDYDPESGYATSKCEAGKDYVKLDVFQCPCATICIEQGCPEIARLFCIRDDISYKDMRGVEFIRKGTLGRGDDCCDFLFRRK